MASPPTAGETLQTDLAAAAKEGAKVKDILKGMNDAMRKYNTSSHDIKQTSADITKSYAFMLVNIKKIGDANDRSLVSQHAIKTIDSQIAAVNSHVADLKKRGLILDDDEVKYRQEELSLERSLNKAIIERLVIRKTATNLSGGEIDAINKQIDQLNVKDAMLKAEGTFIDKRKTAGDILLKGLDVEIQKMEVVKGELGEIVKLGVKQSENDGKRNVLLKSFLGILESMSPILGKTGNEFVTMGKNITKAYKEGGFLAVAMQTVTEYVQIGVGRFKELQETAEKFRKDTGLTLSQTSAISKYVKELNVQYQSMGVSLETANDSARELMSELGNSKVLDNNKFLIQTSSLLAANYGVAASDAAGFQLNMMRVGKNSSESAENMSAVAIQLSKASGVSLPVVMKNVASASGTTLGMVRGSSVELIKAAVHAKRFGVELETISSAARKSLNFYESITDEMEASVLVGQQLSFQSARERSFAGDMVGFQNEILKTVGSISKFGERSIFEQEAVAKAAGMELKDLKKMLQVEEQLKTLSASDRADYDRLLKSNAAITEEDGKQLLKKQEIQSQLTRINNSFTAIKNKIGDSLQPVLEKVANVIESIANLMGGVSKSTEYTGEKSTSVWKSLGIVILAAAVGIGLLVASLKLVSLLSLGLGNTFKALAKAIGGSIANILHSIGNGLKGLSGGLEKLGSKKALIGALTLGILAIAAIGLAFAFKLAAEGISLLLDKGFGFGELMAAMLTAAASLWIISAGLIALGAAAEAVAPGVGILIAALLAIGYSYKLMGEGFKLAGEGAKLFAESILSLSTIGGVGLLGLAAGIYSISVAILALNASFAASAFLGIASLGGMLLTTKFLTNLSSMATELVLVGSALENIANALERISNIKSFPKLEMPQMASIGTTEVTGTAGIASSESVGAKEKSDTNIIDKVDKLTESVGKLVEFMKSGGAIASVYLDKRSVSKELTMV